MELGLGMGCATGMPLKIIPTNTGTVIIADSPYVCPLTLRTIVPPLYNELPLMTPIPPSIMAQSNALDPKPAFFTGERGCCSTGVAQSGLRTSRDELLQLRFGSRVRGIGCRV